jgi:uridine nucleosidase
LYGRDSGDSGIDGTELLPKASRAPITDKNPILAMRDALMAQPKGTPWVIATGTLTNVALLFATFPEVAAHIKGLSIMGGGVGEGFSEAPISRLDGHENRIGNVTPLAEFNIYVCVLPKNGRCYHFFLTMKHHAVRS